MPRGWYTFVWPPNHGCLTACETLQKRYPRIPPVFHPYSRPSKTHVPNPQPCEYTDGRTARFKPQAAQGPPRSPCRRRLGECPRTAPSVKPLQCRPHIRSHGISFQQQVPGRGRETAFPFGYLSLPRAPAYKGQLRKSWE